MYQPRSGMLADDEHEGDGDQQHADSASSPIPSAPLHVPVPTEGEQQKESSKDCAPSPSAGVYASVYASIFSSPYDNDGDSSDDENDDNRHVPPPPPPRPRRASAHQAVAPAEAIEASLSRCGSEIQISHKTLSTVTDGTRASSVSAAGGSSGGRGADDTLEDDESVLGMSKRKRRRPLFGTLCYYCGGGMRSNTSQPGTGVEDDGREGRGRRKNSAVLVGGLVVMVLVVLSLIIVVAVVATGRGRGHEQSTSGATEVDSYEGFDGGSSGGTTHSTDTSDHDDSDAGSIHSESIFANPTASLTPGPTQVPVTYVPGDLTVHKEGVILSTGLDVRIIARSRQFVNLTDGRQSVERFHNRPDAGATFSIPEDYPELYDKYPGGYVYVSNAESTYDGGVGSVVFDANYNVVDYRKVLKGTEWNCGGGKTPWGTWVSCEEPMGYNRTGFIYEVDPFGRYGPEPRRTVLGEDGGAFESFAYDARDRSNPHFFYTEDHRQGPIRRFTPTNPDWDNPAQMLHLEGTIEYLVLENSDWTGKNGTFYWTDDRDLGEENAMLTFPYTEGIDCTPDGRLFFANKARALLFELELDSKTWSRSSVQGGAFDGKPDTTARILNDPADIVYMTEDGGDDAGVHGRDKDNNYYVILESPLYHEETTGLSFSPDGRRMYVAYQKNGILLDVWREDGLPFSGRALDIKYHSLNSERDNGII